MAFVSYAQNHEDLILYRALKDVTNGFYVDVGANHAILDSATQAFYERGWRGINIEPVPQWYASLVEHRPEDKNLQCVVQDRASLVEFYELDGSGLSTLSKELAEKWSHMHGFALKTLFTPGYTLTQILDSCNKPSDIHFLKVDVEGAEADVIRGFDLQKYRPWIVVVESTSPLSQHECHGEWELMLLEKGYQHVYSDGLNRYYLADERIELRDAFKFPPNVFDEVVPFKLATLYQRLEHVAIDCDATSSIADYDTFNCSKSAWDTSIHFQKIEHLVHAIELKLDAKSQDIVCLKDELAQAQLIAHEQLASAEAHAEAHAIAQATAAENLLKARVDALEAEVANAWHVAATFERKIKSMRATLAWKVSAPLRELGRVCSKLFQKLQKNKAPLSFDRKSLKNKLKGFERRFRHYRRGIKAPQPSPAITSLRPLSNRASQVYADIQAAMQSKESAA